MIELRKREETAIITLFSLSGVWVAGGIVWLIMPENSRFLDLGRFGCSFWIGVIFFFMVSIAMKSVIRRCRGGRKK